MWGVVFKWRTKYFLYLLCSQNKQTNYTHKLNLPFGNALQQSCLKVKSLSRVRLLATPWAVAYQTPLSMVFSRQQSWSGLPFPSPGDLPNPGIEPGSPTLQTDALPSEPPGKSLVLPRKPHEQRNLVGYSSWDHKESATNELLTCSHFTEVY